MRKLALRPVAVALLLAISVQAPLAVARADPPRAPIRIGVLAFRGAEHVVQSWTPTARYLSRVIPGERFEIVPLPLVELHHATSRGTIDYVLTNSGQYVVLEEKFGISRIATLKKPFTDALRNVFGAVIVARAGRDDLKTLQDIKGKVFGAVSRQAFGGFQMAWRELKENGLDPFKALKAVKFFGFPQDSIVIAVRDGIVDAGTVRTGVIETMAKEGEIDLNDFLVLNHRHVPGATVALSTRLYPEWPFAKMPHVSAELSEKLAIALLSLPADSPEMRAAGASGWTVPLDYKPVHDLFRELEIGPYARGEFNLVSVLRHYWQWMLFASVLMVSIVLHGIRTEYLIQRRTRELSALNRELEHEINERRAAEQRARQHEAELAHVSRINDIDEMTSGLAHELRQPLAAIRNYAEGGLRRLRRGADNTAEMDEALSHIADQAGRAGKIISRVRGYMQKREPKREAVNLNHAVRESLGFVGADARAAGVVVSENLADEMANVRGDLIEFEQLIINLCRNAIEAMSGREGEKNLAVATGQRDDLVWVRVLDNGPGLAVDEMEAIWQPFMTTKERGLGLGLAICRSIVESHGGRIQAESPAAGGLSIEFEIPAMAMEDTDET